MRQRQTRPAQDPDRWGHDLLGPAVQFHSQLRRPDKFEGCQRSLQRHVDVEWINLIKANHPVLYRVLLAAMTNESRSYFAYMAARLMEMQQLLKSAGSICHHRNPTYGQSLGVAYAATKSCEDILALVLSIDALTLAPIAAGAACRRMPLDPQPEDQHDRSLHPGEAYGRRDDNDAPIVLSPLTSFQMTKEITAPLMAGSMPVDVRSTTNTGFD